MFQYTFVATLLVANAAAFSFALHDRSWNALRIAILFGPILNGVFLIGGLASAVILKRRGLRMSLLLAITAPSVATCALFGAILSLGLHGC
jgi:hypothetical protein